MTVRSKMPSLTYYRPTLMAVLERLNGESGRGPRN